MYSRVLFVFHPVFLDIKVKVWVLSIKFKFRSGTEEQYTEVEQLLDDIVSYITDLKIQQSKNNKKDADDKQKGVELRDKAMETLKRSNYKSI